MVEKTISDFPKAMEFLGLQPDLKLQKRYKAEVLIHVFTTAQKAKIALLYSALLATQKTKKMHRNFGIIPSARGSNKGLVNPVTGQKEWLYRVTEKQKEELDIAMLEALLDE